MSPEEILEDAACALGVPAPPPPLVALAELDPELLSTAWAAGGSWFDSEFFEEAAVVAGAGVEEVADELPPPEITHVRYGGLGGSDLPRLDRALEGLIQAVPRTLLLMVAWQHAISADSFGNPSRSGIKPLCPGAPGWLRDVPRPPVDGTDLADRAAGTLGVPIAAGHLLALTPWPYYLDVATADAARRAGEEAFAAAVDRIGGQAAEIVASVAPPMPELHGAKGKGADLIAQAAESYPATTVITAYLRLGLPYVERIPRVA